ncbi:MAG: lipoyl synthase [Haloferacaceae archaeon]
MSVTPTRTAGGPPRRARGPRLPQAFARGATGARMEGADAPDGRARRRPERRKPDWLKVRPPSGQRFTEIKSALRDRNLNTVCEEANCPNMGECWSGRSGPGTATFMLMGDRCSRGCNFCDVRTGGMEALDPDEPADVADAVAEIGLDYVVLTSVDRDDLPDQGAGHFAETVREIKARDEDVLVETLVPDFRGEPALVDEVLDAGPDVFAHNVETVERLQWPVRDRRAGYEQSLSVLARAADRDVYAKTSLMLGLGEYAHEVYRTLTDLREVGVDVVTFGQYLQPSRSHLDVFEYVHPATFETWRRVAEEELGFLYCASGPMVRSSYRAGELFVEAVERDGRDVEAARRTARADG